MTKFLNRSVAGGILALTSLLSVPVAAKESQTAQVVEFPVTINCTEFAEQRGAVEGVPPWEEQTYQYFRYPLLLYRDVTYLPMTYSKLNLLGLTMQIEGQTIHLTQSDTETCRRYSGELLTDADFSGGVTVGASPFAVTINGVPYDNAQYPVLFYQDIVYLPLTWTIIHDLMGGMSVFDENGLTLLTDAYYYTSDADSSIIVGEDGGVTYRSVENSTYYGKGGTRIYAATSYGLMPSPDNLSIWQNGKETAVSGYSGYYQKGGALFTVDGDTIQISHYLTEGDAGEREPRPSHISIATGEVTYLDEE